jgi:two-component system response regulator HydG
MKPRPLLVVDDEAEMVASLTEVLVAEGHTVESFTSAGAALDSVAKVDFGAALIDLTMTEMSGLVLCERCLAIRPDLSVIVVTGQGSMESAVAALRAGAYDFLTKPVDSELVSLTVARALHHRNIVEELRRLHETSPDPGDAPAGIIGRSTAMTRIYDVMNRIATSDATVLIHGETGTGKEVVAKAIHQTSGRAKGPFVAINCAAVPEGLLESELFGHARGAFTNAHAARTGLLVQATGGTLFLDEIGDLPLEVQPKLLRALQERQVRPVGSNEEVGFDARVITATNRDLEVEVGEKRFREDLYYRINVVTVDLPPLRDRAGDILLLAQHFLDRAARAANKGALSFNPSAAEKLMAYSWPGNVRELENCVERAVALARFDQITVDDLPEKVRAYRPDQLVVSAEDRTSIVSLEELERRYVLQVLRVVGGNKSQAAQLLGLDRRTLYRKLDHYRATGGAGESDLGGRSAKPTASTARSSGASES